MNWTNWSGAHHCSPDQLLEPDSEAKLQAIVDRYAGERTIRVAGSGHSFSPVVPTDDVLVSLANYTGITRVNPATEQVTVRAGTTLGELTTALDDHGLALKNMGDVDAQTVAGALATGTHGTGIDLGIMPTQIASVRLIRADGECQTIEPADGEQFRAIQLSLGTLGIISEITLNVRSAYRLRENSWIEPLDAVLDKLETLRANNRHVECFWFPHTDRALIKTLNPTSAAPTRGVPYRLDERAENLAWGAVCRLSARMPQLSPRLARFVAGTLDGTTAVGPSHEIFPTMRAVRFNEMEYAVPADAGVDAVRALRAEIRDAEWPIVFPIEFRYTRGDDILLSPAYGRDTAFIAVHAYHRTPYQAYFDACETIFAEYDGRPHWGKMNGCSPTALRDRFPEFETFASIRASFDPAGTFLNPELEPLFQ